MQYNLYKIHLVLKIFKTFFLQDQDKTKTWTFETETKIKTLAVETKTKTKTWVFKTKTNTKISAFKTEAKIKTSKTGLETVSRRDLVSRPHITAYNVRTGS